MNPKPSLSKWLPSPGNILFTLLVAAGLLLYAHRAGAFPASQSPTPSATSTTTLPYQGRLTDSDGNPVNATKAMTFRLYNVASGGTALWQEAWPTVNVSDGLFNVLLGSTTPIPQNVISENNDLWLGVSVGADTEMTPRVQLGSVPFSMQALTVPDEAISTSMLANGAVTSEKTALQHYTVSLGFFQTTSTTFVDIPGSSITFTVNTTSTVLIGFTGSLYTMMQTNGAAGALMTLNLDGNDRTDLVNQDLFAWSGTCCAPNPAISPAGFSTILTVGPGTHVIKLRILSLSYNPDYRYAGIGYNSRNSTFSAVILGK